MIPHRGTEITERKQCPPCSLLLCVFFYDPTEARRSQRENSASVFSEALCGISGIPGLRPSPESVIIRKNCFAANHLPERIGIMKETISYRVRRIISASIQQLTDVFENITPDTVAENVISETEEVIEDVRSELGRNIASRHMSSKRFSHAKAQHKDLSAKIEAALRENREDLAQIAVSRQLDIEAQMPVLESAEKELDERIKELEGYIAALEARKREMKAELREFRQTNAEFAGNMSADDPGGDFQSRISRAEFAFERVMEKQTGHSGDRTDLKEAGQLAELDDLVRNHRIQERLAHARAGMKGDSKR